MDDTSDIKLHAGLPRTRIAQSDSQNDQFRGNVLSKVRIEGFSNYNDPNKVIVVEENLP